MNDTEFDCFSEHESLNDASIFEAVVDSAPVCRKRPPAPLADIRYEKLIDIAYGVNRIPLKLLWYHAFAPTGPPVELAA